MNLSPERLTDIFDDAVNKSSCVSLRAARVEAMRRVLDAIGFLAKSDEEAALAQAYRKLAPPCEKKAGGA